MPFELRYHPDVKMVDLPLLDNKIKKRIKTAIETRLAVAPHLYGEPLRKTLKGYWKLRVGDYRVVFKIVQNEVWIFGIIHRKRVYEMIEKRL
ncbi:MAG: type II toxin-antitoxin system RelE/ParE family toxin [Candidatus Roizmanbacteria bacterium]|nr:type II toxin-antitoxin system RelE/ParE family toxin [Candidatus Roizmanbacteria bacterium]